MRDRDGNDYRGFSLFYLPGKDEVNGAATLGDAGEHTSKVRLYTDAYRSLSGLFRKTISCLLQWKATGRCPHKKPGLNILYVFTVRL